MSIQVNSIDEYKAKAELKKCPKLVRDYVRALESVYEMNKTNLNLAIAKIRELTK